MCRSFDGLWVDDPRLRIRSFHLRLRQQIAAVLPEAMMLVFLPGVDGEGVLEINGAKVAPGSSAMVLMSRVRTVVQSEAEYVSVDRVRAGGGVVRFEVWAGEERVLEGVFRRRGGEGWTLEWRCGGKRKAAEAEAWAVVEGGGVVAGRRGRCCGLEEIPEEREIGWVVADGCDCREEEDDGEMDGGDGADEMDGGDEATGMELVGWAVDLGIWVVCLGMAGFLASRVSNVGSKRKRLFHFR